MTSYFITLRYHCLWIVTCHTTPALLSPLFIVLLTFLLNLPPFFSFSSFSSFYYVFVVLFFSLLFFFFVILRLLFLPFTLLILFIDFYLSSVVLFYLLFTFFLAFSVFLNVPRRTGKSFEYRMEAKSRESSESFVDITAATCRLPSVFVGRSSVNLSGWNK